MFNCFNIVLVNSFDLIIYYFDDREVTRIAIKINKNDRTPFTFTQKKMYEAVKVNK